MKKYDTLIKSAFIAIHDARQGIAEVIDLDAEDNIKALAVKEVTTKLIAILKSINERI